MDNPFKIHPGEKLSLDEVFNRYLDSTQWDVEAKRNLPQIGCDQRLHQAHLCCADHIAMVTENHLFFAYFYHLTYDETIRGKSGFSMILMRDFIKKHKIGVTLSKAGNYFGMSRTEWGTFFNKR